MPPRNSICIRYARYGETAKSDNTFLLSTQYRHAVQRNMITPDLHMKADEKPDKQTTLLLKLHKHMGRYL